MAQEMDKLQSLVDADEILLPNSPLYARESRTWAVNRNQQPKVLIRPKSIDSLSKTLAYLSTTNLKFAVRSQGFGSASAKDVIISMTAFDEFHFDKENMSVTLGAGQPWRDYYTKMEEAAPEYTGESSQTFVSEGKGLLLIQSWLVGHQQSALVVVLLVQDSPGSLQSSEMFQIQITSWTLSL